MCLGCQCFVDCLVLFVDLYNSFPLYTSPGVGDRLRNEVLVCQCVLEVNIWFDCLVHFLDSNDCFPLHMSLGPRGGG
jgi:hypothetical protein